MRRPMMFRTGTILLISLAGVLFLGMASLGCGSDSEAGMRAYLPLTFHAEAGMLQTSACLGLLEYSADTGFGGRGQALERVIAAFENKDRDALFEMADPVDGRDPKRFDDQASAFFQQFDSMDFVGIRHAFAFDGFMLFFGEVKYGDRSLSVPFVFSNREDGLLGFLPYRTQALSYSLVKDWFELTSRPGSPSATKYCSPEAVRGSTHQIEVPPIESNNPQLNLLLTGAPIDSTGRLSKSAERVKEVIEAIKRALTADSATAVAARMTLEGGNRLKSWWATATQAEKGFYKRSVLEQDPFFLFDASPLVVVYTRGPGGIQVMYFTRSASGDLVWTNSSHVTEVDKLFKGGVLEAAAALEEPFSSVEIN